MNRVLQILLISLMLPVGSFAQTTNDQLLALINSLMAQITALKDQVTTLSNAQQQTTQIVTTGQANAVQPGMGGIPLTGILPQYPTQIEMLGTPTGPPINTGPETTCDKTLQPQRPRSADEPSLDWSCKHIALTAVTQIAYRSTTNNNCYFSSLHGTFKLNKCIVGLPAFPTNADGTLTKLLDPNDPSINWAAGGAQAYYVPGDTSSQFYGGLALRLLGASPNGRSLPLTGAAFCAVYSTDASCNMTQSATATTPSSTQPTLCTATTSCGTGFACYGLSLTNPGMCGAVPK